VNRRVACAAPIEDPYFVALNEAEDDPHERDLIRELGRCLDVRETLEVGDETDVARAAQVRDAFWSAFVAGGATRHGVIRELRLHLLDALEAPGLTVDELRARADSGDIVTEEVLGLTLDRENLRDEWVPRLRAALLRDATGRSPVAT
jgi:hypothetical protein